MVKILFIEDDPNTAEVYTIAMKQADFEVVNTRGGEEALEEIKKDKFDLILLDYILPDIDGLTILKEIKKSSKNKNTKVLVTTNYSIDELKNKGKFVEGQKFILKADYPPFKMIELIKKELK